MTPHFSTPKRCWVRGKNESTLFIFTTTEKQLAQAQTTGSVILANLELTSIPTEVFHLLELTFSKEDNWWERNPVIKMDISHNQ
jgi:hypothetical protein